MADKTVFIDNQVLNLLFKGTVSNDQGNAVELPVLLQGDGTLRGWQVMVGRDPDGRERPVLVESDRTPRSQVILWDYTGADQIRAAGEPTTGEFRNLIHGKDEGDVIDAFRTDPNRIQWNRPYDGYVEVPSAEIPVAEGDLWAPGLGDSVRYLVEFTVINNDAGNAAVTGVYVGRDIDAAGGLAAPEYWMFNETIPHPGMSGWRGPFYMHGDDAVRGVAGVANDASIHFRVKRVDTGA